MRTLIDEYGDTGIVQPPYGEKRRNSKGPLPSPAPRDDRSYCERQIAPKDSGAPADVCGAVIDGP